MIFVFSSKFFWLSAVVIIALFAVFIGFRDNTALVSAMSAAGTVLAAGFAAVAAYGSVKAAGESSESSRKAQEAVARAAKPSVRATLETVDGTVHGSVQATDAAAVDVTVVWVAGGQTLHGSIAVLEPGVPLTTDLRVPENADLATEIDMLWMEYSDARRVAKWQDMWRVGLEPPRQGMLVLTDSRLTD